MRYRRKDCVVEAYRFHSGNGPQDWPEGWLNRPHSIIGDGVCTISDGLFDLTAMDGAWILKDEAGCFHVTNDDYFKQMYEPVENNV